MDLSTIFTALGTIATIIGAIVSFWQARVSGNAAKDVKRIRAELIDHRKTSELSLIQAVCRKSQRSMEKYGPASSPSSLIGVSYEKDAQDVQEFLLLLIENRAYFGSKAPNAADEFCENMNQLLGSFSQSLDSSDARRVGTQILLSISNMASVIKKLLDTKAEAIH